MVTITGRPPVSAFRRNREPIVPLVGRSILAAAWLWQALRLAIMGLLRQFRSGMIWSNTIIVAGWILFGIC